MIIQEELSATLDEPTDCLIMHRVEPSRLQMLALNLTDKIQMLAENNEQILEPRTGRAGYSGTAAWFPGRERQGEKQRGTGNIQVWYNDFPHDQDVNFFTIFNVCVNIPMSAKSPRAFDKISLQGDRRTGQSQGSRQGANVWGSQNNRRRDRDSQRRN